MQPYVIKQGDYLALLAYQYGFDASTIWNDSSNDDLRALRPNPNILWPTDVLHIPNQAKPGGTSDSHDLATGQTNVFASNAPTVPVTIGFQDASLASQPITVQELPELVGLTTGADGTLSLSVPVTLGSFTVVFTESSTTVEFDLGGLDPIDTPSGVFHRLKNLGFIDVDVAFDPADLRGIRTALRAFVEAQARPDNSPAAAVGYPDDTQPPPSQGSAEDASGEAQSRGTDDQPSLPLCYADVDDAGLSDDGKLEDSTAQKLLEAHGC